MVLCRECSVKVDINFKNTDQTRFTNFVLGTERSGGPFPAGSDPGQPITRTLGITHVPLGTNYMPCARFLPPSPSHSN